MLSDDDFEQICKESGLGVSNLTRLHLPLDESANDKLPVLNELALTALMRERSARDVIALNFLSAGYHDNFIPSVIKAKKTLVELNQTLLYGASKEVLNVAIDDIDNYLSRLSGMPVYHVVNDDLITLLANLLLYSRNISDLNETTRVLIPSTVSPAIRNALRSQLKYQSIELVVLDYDKNSGCLTLPQLTQFESEDVLAVVLGWPNFLGQIEDLAELADWAKNKGSLVIALSSPISLSILKSPADIAPGNVDYLMGELQSVGFSASHGGNSPCYLASCKALEGELNVYVKTQKKNNINLAVIQSTLSISGIPGLYHSAKQSNDMLTLLVDKLTDIEGVTKRFLTDNMHECVIQMPNIDIEKALKILAGHNMVFGYLLQDDYPELTNCLLVYCSDRHTLSDIDKVVNKVTTVVKNLSTAGCPVKPKFN